MTSSGSTSAGGGRHSTRIRTERAAVPRKIRKVLESTGRMVLKRDGLKMKDLHLVVHMMKNDLA